MFVLSFLLACILDYLANSFTYFAFLTSVPDEVHLEDDESTLPSLQTETSSRYLGQDLPQINGFSGSRLYTQMVTKDWESALATVEESPEEGCEWQYGIELDRIESLDSAIMWKRLPIHSACVLHTPIGLIEALIWAYPKGIRVKDPFTGSIPLHLACRHSAPPELVKTVIMAYPAGSRIEDFVGRVPLHMACLSGASRLTFIYLLKAFPHAVLIKDDRRRTPLQYAKQNPTLKPETVELLELVHQFLEKQPPAEDDYTFEGFSAPRSIGHGSDDGSTVSGFYEDTYSAGRLNPPADDDLDVSPLSGGSQPIQEETNDELLAEQYSQILENGTSSADDTGAPVGEEEDISGRVTPKFGVSKARREKERALMKRADKTIMQTRELSLILEEDSASEEMETATEEDARADELPQFSVISMTDEAAQPLAISPIPAVDAERPTVESSKISEEVDSAEDAVASTEDVVVEKIMKLGVLMTKSKEGETTTSSLICLSGVDQSERGVHDRSNSTDALDSSKVAEMEATEIQEENLARMEEEVSVQSRQDDAEAVSSDFVEEQTAEEQTAEEGQGEATEIIVQSEPSTANDAVEDEEEALPSTSEPAKEDTEKIDDTEAQSQRVTATYAVAVSKQKPPSPTANAAVRDSKGFANLAEMYRSPKKAKDTEATGNNANVVTPGSQNEPPADKKDSVKEDEESRVIACDPADIAAGCCSPSNLPVSESPSGGAATDRQSSAVNTTKSDNRSAEEFEVVPDEQDVSVDEGSIPYEPLIDDDDESEMPGIFVDHDGSSEEEDTPEAMAVSDHSACNTCTQDGTQPIIEGAATQLSIPDIQQASTEETVAASIDAQVEKEDAAAEETRETECTISEDTDDDADKPPSEDSAEFHFDSKSELSQTGESIVDHDSITSIHSEPSEPVVIQERDDQNKTNSPKKEERLDIHAC